MPRVFVSSATGAAVYVFADDHCPPHVHARHRGDGWMARVAFSYLDRSVRVMSIAPLKNVPLPRAVNQLLDDVQDRLADCRRSWWTARETTCLENQWAATATTGQIELGRAGSGSKQIAEAVYDPAHERLRVVFRDGAVTEASMNR